MDNLRLYGLEDICVEILMSLILHQKNLKIFLSQKNQVISWISVVLAYVPGVFCGLVIGHMAYLYSTHT